MSYFPKDEAEYAANSLAVHIKDLQHVAHHVLTDQLDVEAIHRMMSIMAEIREGVEMVDDWIERAMQ